MSRKYVDTKQRVRELWELGYRGAEIARRLGIGKGTVSYHLRTLGKPVDERCNRRYDWEEIQRYYDAGHSISQCQQKFGFSRETWNAARMRGAVRTRPQALPLDDLFTVGPKRGRENLKRRLLAAGLRENRCERCGVDQWRGKPLSLALHHLNGDGRDNRLENLELLCPNCHSQTENFAGRNKTSRLQLVEVDPATVEVDPAAVEVDTDEIEAA